MVVEIAGPFQILVNQTLKPLFQLLGRKILAEPADLFRLHGAVGNLDPHGRFPVIPGVKAGVAFRLGQVERVRFNQPVHVHINALDLIDHPASGLFQNPVRPALHQDLKLFFPYPSL